MDAKGKAKAKLQETRGMVKQKVGKATGDRYMELSGRRDKAAGAMKSAGHKVKDAFR